MEKEQLFQLGIYLRDMMGRLTQEDRDRESGLSEESWSRSELAVDFKAGQVELDGQQYRIGAVGAAAQELILAGGLEDWVKEQGVG